MTLLVAVKSVERDSELVRSARALAAAAGWDVLAVHVRRAATEPRLGEIGGVDPVNLTGDPGDELVRLVARAEEVDCIGVGLSCDRDSPLGSVARVLLERTSLPVFLVRADMRPLRAVQRLLVPLEGTPSSSAAMRFVEDRLCKPGREIIMVNVATGRAPGEIGSLPAPCFIDQEQYEWAEWQDEFARRFSPRVGGRDQRIDVIAGDPPEAIAAAARADSADLVVLCWKGSFLAGHGRIVLRLMETSPCPLLLIPATWTAGPRDTAMVAGA
jgi:nucleotide-binding universal stress UspA family protein